MLQEPDETERGGGGKPAEPAERELNSTWAANPEARAALGELMQPLSPFLDYTASETRRQLAAQRDSPGR